jgi:hypothetical protein
VRFIGYVTRVLSCFLLLFATWNPLGYSYAAWIGGDDGTRLSLKVAVGALLLVIYAIYLRITWLALGLPGFAMALTILLTGYMMLRHLGVFDAQAPFWTGYLMLTLASVVFSAGLCWAHFKRRVTGISQTLYPPP